MKQLRRFAAVLAVLALCPAAALADCNLSLVGPVTQQPLTYNPFQSGGASAAISFTLRNAASKPCSAAFALFKLGVPQASASGASLAYQVLSASAGVTQSAASPPEKLGALAGAGLIALGANATATATATLSVSEGQVIGPGAYTDQLILGVYQSPGNGAPYAKAFEMPLSVLISINAQVTLAIAGGGRHTTLNFGNFVEGAVRSVNLLAYANQGFHLTVSSDNAGLMKPTDPASLAEGWRVPYTVAIFKTAPVDLAQQRIISLWPKATQRTGLAIPVDVQVGSIKGQRAGIYRDVITIAIDPMP